MPVGVNRLCALSRYVFSTTVMLFFLLLINSVPFLCKPCSVSCCVQSVTQPWRGNQARKRVGFTIKPSILFKEYLKKL